MIQVLQNAARAIPWPEAPMSASRVLRVVVLLIVVSFLFMGPGVREAALSALADAYIQVTVFVGGTLFLVYGIAGAMRRDIGEFLESTRSFQPAVAAFLGATPGCGGAIIVVTQYTRGYASFGSLIAVLTATMGDAAFLLLAVEPLTGLFVITLSFFVGTGAGMLVDAVHGPDFMRYGKPPEAPPATTGEAPPEPPGPVDWLWLAMIVPGVVFGLMTAFQIDVDHWLGLAEARPVFWFSVAGTLLCLAMWGLSARPNSHAGAGEPGLPQPGRVRKVVLDTNFVTAWVVVGFLTYEIGAYLAGGGIETWFEVWAPFVPAMAVLVGFIPGCGPQVIVTSLYLAGALPFSAQIGNALANDGDALFPAIALAPRAALLATLYSGVPAFIVAYGWYFLFE